MRAWLSFGVRAATPDAQVWMSTYSYSYPEVTVSSLFAFVSAPGSPGKPDSSARRAASRRLDGRPSLFSGRSRGLRGIGPETTTCPSSRFTRPGSCCSTMTRGCCSRRASTGFSQRLPGATWSYLLVSPQTVLRWHRSRRDSAATCPGKPASGWGSPTLASSFTHR